jgi:hypothetical protein
MWWHGRWGWRCWPRAAVGTKSEPCLQEGVVRRKTITGTSPVWNELKLAADDVVHSTIRVGPSPISMNTVWKKSHHVLHRLLTGVAIEVTRHYYVVSMSCTGMKGVYHCGSIARLTTEWTMSVGKKNHLPSAPVLDSHPNQLSGPPCVL